MPPVDRNKPKRAASSESQYSLMEFMREFPDDASCLEWLWHTRYSSDGEHAYCPSPSCKTERTFKRYATSQQRQSWSCTACGKHLHPTAGTIFHKSSTSLHLWFYGMYLMTSTRCGISAKQLERELGVTYKTAWRMMNLIRNQLMTQGDVDRMTGEVEVDETYVGGKPREYPKRSAEWHRQRKATVLGMVERGGRVRAEHIPFSGAGDIQPRVTDVVKAGSVLYTDEAGVYKAFGNRYFHKPIKHVERVYVSGDVHTQTIEGFFSTLKNGLRGTYHAVSKRWLQGYLNEYVWRYNHRDDDLGTFRLLLLRAAIA
jgi:transposase